MSVDYQMDLTVITLLDGLKHTYFSYLELYKDNYSPVGTSKLVLPLDNSILNYWNSYYDIVIVSAKLKNSKQNTNSKDYYQKIISERSKNIANIKSNKKEKEAMLKIFKQKIENDEYNFSFIGKVSKVHRQGRQILIDLEDIGWKFMQYVPDDFRSQYIAGQSVDDAFQAMCELMGVEFAYSLDKLNEYTFAPDGFSIIKDNQTIEVVPNFFEEIKNENDNNSTPKKTEKEDMQDLNKKIEKLKQEGKTQEAESLASEITNQTRESSSNGPSNSIEIQNEKKEKYEIEFESKIKDLFIGNTFYDSNLTDTNYNYDSITITPKTTSDSSSMQTINNPNDPTNTDINTSSITKTTPTTITPNTNLGNLSNIARAGQQSRLTSAKSPTNLNTVVNPMTIGIRK